MEAVHADWKEYLNLLICEESHLKFMEDYHQVAMPTLPSPSLGAKIEQVCVGPERPCSFMLAWWLPEYLCWQGHCSSPWGEACGAGIKFRALGRLTYIPALNISHSQQVPLKLPMWGPER